MMRDAPPRLIAVCLIGLLTAASAQAEGLFDFLFGDSDSERSAPAPSVSAPRRWQRRSVAPREDSIRRQKGDGDQASYGRRGKARDAELSASGYCVRTCDGYFFPLIRSSRATGQQSCEFLCPTAPVELYAGSSIETARNAKGERYAALPAAFSFRDKTTEKCTCNDPNASLDNAQLARTDPTLRSGDVVVKESGPFVYNGASLVTLGGASFLSSQNRQRLRAMLMRNGGAEASREGAARGSHDLRGSRPTKSTLKPMEAQGTIEFVAPSRTQ